VHGDSVGAESLRRSLADRLTDINLISAGGMAENDGDIEYLGPMRRRTKRSTRMNPSRKRPTMLRVPSAKPLSWRAAVASKIRATG